MQISRCSAHQLCWLGRRLDCGWRSPTTILFQGESCSVWLQVGRLDGRGKQVPPPCARLSAPVWALAAAPACPYPWAPSAPLQVPLLRFSPPPSTLTLLPVHAEVPATCAPVPLPIGRPRRAPLPKLAGRSPPAVASGAPLTRGRPWAAPPRGRAACRGEGAVSSIDGGACAPPA